LGTDLLSLLVKASFVLSDEGKAFRVLHDAIHHEGVKGIERVVVRFFNPGGRRRSIVCCIPWLMEKELPASYEYGLG